MKTTQKLTPKYWVVHDKTTDDVFIDTARKGLAEAIDAFMDKHSYDRWGIHPDDKLQDLWFEDACLEVILVEINMLTSLV